MGNLTAIGQRPAPAVLCELQIEQAAVSHRLEHEFGLLDAPDALR
jgi:hypothetical protein